MRWSTNFLLAMWGLAACLAGGCGGSAEPTPANSVASNAAADANPAAGGSGSAPAADPMASGETGMPDEPGASGAGASSSGPSEMPMPMDDYGGSSTEDPYGGDSMPASEDYEQSMMENNYGDEGYGPDSYGAEGYGGQAAPPKGMLGSLTGGLQAQLQSFLGPALLSAGAKSQSPKRSSLREMANEAFVGGDEALARKYLHAHMASEYESAGGAFEEVAFSPILRTPLWMMRWGVAMHVRGDAADGPHPIVENMSSPLGAAGGAMAGRRGLANPSLAAGSSMEPMGGMEEMGMPGQGAGMASSAVGSPDAQRAFETNLGLVGETVGTMFDARFNDGTFGRGFLGTAATMAAPPVVANAGFDADQAAMSAMYSGEGEMDEAAIDQRRRPGGMEAIEGMPGGPPAGMSDAMMGQEARGDIPQVGRAAGGNRAGGAPISLSPQFNPELPRWRPGIAYLGEVPITEALAKAKEADLQFLLFFDVSVQAQKNRTIVKVLNVADGKTVVTSKKLDNVEAFKLAQAERQTEREYVNEVVSDMFTVVDEKLKVTPLAKLTPDVAKRRVASLLETAGRFDWASMAEVRLFQYQQLLSEDETATAMHLFGGDDALILMYGTPDERREVALREMQEQP